MLVYANDLSCGPCCYPGYKEFDKFPLFVRG